MLTSVVATEVCSVSRKKKRKELKKLPQEIIPQKMIIKAIKESINKGQVSITIFGVYRVKGKIFHLP